MGQWNIHPNFLDSSGELHALGALPRVMSPRYPWVGTTTDLDTEKRKILAVRGVELPTPRPSGM
jgi:hypothetical protein